MRLTLLFFAAFTATQVAAQTYDGTWTGTTGQDKEISFVISGNKITTITIAGKVTAVGCSSNFTVKTDYSSGHSMTYPSFSFTSGTTAPGGTQFTISGVFASTRSVSGNLSFNTYAIPGVGGCSGSGSTTWTATNPAGGGPVDVLAAVFAVAGSTAGSFGSYFRTSLQLHNPGTTTMTGKLVYHPANSAGSGSDPSLSYSLGPYQTVSYNDVIAEMGRGGTGSLDLLTTTGSAPLTALRIYNDAGEKGTSGMGLDPLAPLDALQSGQTAVLIAPADPSKFRFNIGVRTLSSAVSMQIAVRDKDGVLRNSTTQSWGPTFFTQLSASAIAGIDLRPSDSIAFTINSGSAIVYGAMTDNTTQDPTLQYAKKLF